MLFHKQRVIKIVGEFVYLKISLQSWRENKAVICERKPFSSDLQNLENLETELCSMTARTLNFWLIKFVQEACDKDGKPYPGRKVYQIICSLKRHLDENGRAKANMLNANNHW
jgi:hypothetical protein